MDILTISEDALRVIFDEKPFDLHERIDFLSDQNNQLKKTINNLLKKSNPKEKLTVKEAAKELKARESTIGDGAEMIKLNMYYPGHNIE